MNKLSALALSFAFLGSFLVGCGGKPTKDECEKFADHFVKLMLEGQGEASGDAASGLGKEVHDELVDSCMKEGTKKEVDCVLNAKTADEIEANCDT